MATSINNWGSEAVKIQRSQDRIDRAGDWSTLTDGAGDAGKGRQTIDSVIPLDHDYTPEARRAQQQKLHEMMKTIRLERNGRNAE